MISAEEKEEGVLLTDGAGEKEEIDLQIKKEIIKIDNMKIEMKEMVNLLVLTKSLMERKKASKKGFLIKRKDFQEFDICKKYCCIILYLLKG